MISPLQPDATKELSLSLHVVLALLLVQKFVICIQIHKKRDSNVLKITKKKSLPHRISHQEMAGSTAHNYQSKTIRQD